MYLDKLAIPEHNLCEIYDEFTYRLLTIAYANAMKFVCDKTL